MFKGIVKVVGMLVAASYATAVAVGVVKAMAATCPVLLVLTVLTVVVCLSSQRR